MPRFSQIWPVRAGHELPAKMSVLRIVGLGKVVPKRRKEKRDDPASASASAASCCEGWWWQKKLLGRFGVGSSTEKVG
jgi:hypothetical protein